MTSASELFYSRRHRLGRNNALDLGFESPPSPSPAPPHLHLNRLHHHRLHELGDADSLRRHDHVRRLRHRSSYTERASDRFDWRIRGSLLNDSDDSVENVRGLRGPMVSVSDRLPVGVLLARARLLERLRGEPVPVSRNRLYGRDSMGGDQESELPSDVSTGGSVVTDLTSQMGRSHLLQELNQKPPGLTQEALDCLHLEVFSSRETGLESNVLQDCGICLESFSDGDELIRLPCGHKFHSACLDPWVRCCGDCPYCRRGIVASSHLPQKEAV